MVTSPPESMNVYIIPPTLHLPPWALGVERQNHPWYIINFEESRYKSIYKTIITVLLYFEICENDDEDCKLWALVMISFEIIKYMIAVIRSLVVLTWLRLTSPFFLGIEDWTKMIPYTVETSWLHFLDGFSLYIYIYIHIYILKREVWV